MLRQRIILTSRLSQIFEKEKLEAARAKMIEDMKMNGIDERYFGEIMSLDINKFLMK